MGLRKPWKSFGAAAPEQEYLALLSYLPLRRCRALPRFLMYTLQIERQLRSAKGILGYSLDANPFTANFWTLSVWQDEAVLQEFVHALPHGKVMTALASDMGATRFVRWKIKGSAIPPRWADAMERYRAQGETQKKLLASA